MPSNQSAVSLCNVALLSIGARAQVSSISPSDGSTAADACATYFPFIFNALGRTAWWNCLRAQATLSLQLAAQATPENPNSVAPFPPTPWLYQYSYPSDCLKARAIVPTFSSAGTGNLTSVNNSAPVWLPNIGAIPFAVAYASDSAGSPETVILTNQSQAQLIYSINQPNPVIWDSQFTQAFVASLAAYLVPALALNGSLMQAQIAIADRLINEARSSDGNEGTVTQDREADWIAARTGGATAIGTGTYGSGYDNIAWPTA